MEHRWLPVDEIAEYLGVSRDAVYNWINGREMSAHHTGRFWKFQLNDVEAWARTGHAGIEDRLTPETKG